MKSTNEPSEAETEAAGAITGTGSEQAQTQAPSEVQLQALAALQGHLYSRASDAQLRTTRATRCAAAIAFGEGVDRSSGLAAATLLVCCCLVRGIDRSVARSSMPRPSFILVGAF
jgi:hypothetical protein